MNECSERVCVHGVRFGLGVRSTMRVQRKPNATRAGAAAGEMKKPE
jgi:hypothetical protein